MGTAGATETVAGERTHRHAAFHSLRVAALEPLTDDSVALTFELPEALADEFRWAPGQHVSLRGEDGVRRSYSICTPPSSGRLRVGIKRLPGGAFSGAALDRLRVGDRLDVMTPAGRFTPALDPTVGKGYGLVAAGSGITPLLSIAAAVLETEPRSTVTLVYANRTHRSAMFLDEVHDLKDRYVDRFRVLHVLSREEQDVELLSGRLDADRFGRLLDSLVAADEVDEWFLCGPQAMVTALREVLGDRGAPVVHTELFHADPSPRRPAPGPGDAGAGEPGAGEVGEAAEVTVRLDGRAATFDLARDDVPVLEAALRVRPDAPFACRGGVCGTCRAKLVEGEVEMDTNWALEEEEVARGYVLTCQSHPLTPRVVLDYDA